MPEINNAFYDDLGEAWFEGDDHPIALLRVESRVKIEYVLDVLRQRQIGLGAEILDVACGAGLVSLPLAEAGYSVQGIDISPGSIAEARRRTPEGLDARFAVGDAYALDVPDESVDAVLLLDMLEHVERPADAIAEASRVVRPGGAVFFHTFNKTPLAWALAVHGFKVVSPRGPEHIHVYRLFIPPADLRTMHADAGLEVQEVKGVHPVPDRAFWRSVRQRRVDPAFAFKIGGPPWIGYLGYAVKR
ncbi:bifunctional 2-polyprenyl-6-hydroxyphenol methylase/3-demethylubiquinol 3-O-methyltransferase UbiG [Rubricoccus marinus]|uniref:3-demethylubiquinone-9 3-O-methyltransferase n=1 Tax=Rubricoccus marinus TaxID=716817 RepID=A0A259U0Y3_9BACT|nr:bifunctional 2-polyprenyl-6-hydroxyphenol methylase/3-demethylubiquinol 3-O-methyltransferase UbiG [Rubricoccus marinus]OZC03641.1 3-demethylubiquinone-9 3-O-methyltransferase [Rubricoccus marinus]